MEKKGNVLAVEILSPTVSIGFPVYNGQKYIRKALESLLFQSYRDFEIIVSDNQSSDATVSIVNEYMKKDDRIQLVRQNQNIGCAKNFEFVLSQAKGKFFMWAAHDDIWAPNWLEVLVSEFKPSDIGVRGVVRLLNRGTIAAEKILPDFEKGQFVKCFLRNETDYRSHYTYSLFRLNKLQKMDTSMFFLDYYPDAIFVYAMLKHGGLRSIRNTYHLYRVHDENLGLEYSKRWRGLSKILYRIHPLRYYQYYIRYTDGYFRKIQIVFLIPVKHIYSQLSFWWRGVRQVLTGKKYI